MPAGFFIYPASSLSDEARDQVVGCTCNQLSTRFVGVQNDPGV